MASSLHEVQKVRRALIIKTFKEHPGATVYDISRILGPDTYSAKSVSMTLRKAKQAGLLKETFPAKKTEGGKPMTITRKPMFEIVLKDIKSGLVYKLVPIQVKEISKAVNIETEESQAAQH